MNYFGKHSEVHSSNFSTITVKERTIFDFKVNYKNFNLKINNIFDDDFERPHGYNQGGRQIHLNYSNNF